jgi:hypothetical protein
MPTIDERSLKQMRAEYMAMPGLALTLFQAARFWSLSARHSQRLLSELVDTGFLVRSGRGVYRRRSAGGCCTHGECRAGIDAGRHARPAVSDVRTHAA